MVKKNEGVIRMKSFRNKELAKTFRKSKGSEAYGRIYKNPSWGMSQKPTYVVSYFGIIKKKMVRK